MTDGVWNGRIYTVDEPIDLDSIVGCLTGPVDTGTLEPESVNVNYLPLGAPNIDDYHKEQESEVNVQLC